MQKLIKEKIEYIRKKKWEPGQKAAGHKKGVFLAFSMPDQDTVYIGFSLCHKRDRYDYLNGVRTPGWGKVIAYMRAVKWNEKKTSWSFQKTEDSQDVLIPETIAPQLKSFLERCKIYYKDKSLPEWAEGILDA